MSKSTPKRTYYEAAHKAAERDTPPGGPDGVRAAHRPAQKRTFYEAAHKLGYWAPAPSAYEEESEETRRRFEALKDVDRDVVAHAGKAVLALGALGVVYGDIGTSPLYTEQAIFSNYHATRVVTAGNVFGAASLIFWALMIVVSIKYAGFIMRAHNRGDGGIMALTALLQRNRVAQAAVLVTLGIFGAALFFGDGIITPAISVLGAVGGVSVASSALTHLVVPLSLAILICLFAVQRVGSGTIGWLFGPVMLLWFAVIAVFGLSEVVKDPAVFQALSPSWAVRFFATHGFYGYLVLGGVVLAVTGAEALYADRGHFGPNAIRLGWFGVALPALVLNYLGQGVWILHHPLARDDSSTFNPFFQMLPHWTLWPAVILATVATVIASQAVISGTFSVAKQAVQLGFLPRLKITHTSSVEGQIYVPIVNWTLCIGVVVLTLLFRNANSLGDIYGVAVTGTFILNTVLFLAVAHLLWGTPTRRLVPVGILFLTVEVAFFSANIAKVEHGAWLPLAVGLVLSLIMINWRRGQLVVTRKRVAQEGSLADFLDRLASKKPPVVRVPGVAVFLNPNPETTPLALRAEVEFTRSLHERVVVVSIDNVGIPHVDPFDCLAVRALGHGLFKILHVTIRMGYRDKLSVPDALVLARKQGLLERNLDLEHAAYFVSRISITASSTKPLRAIRERLFIMMARNAASPIDHFGLPPDRTVIMGSQIAL
ncbi:MAG TPA: KUP/HAK/KT family potassium transporter [Solirubrobacteraceae bacterium]|nr:KUP/HAK/KT family potassium transporter [Solirubrobacteraceae bacterium]